MLGQGCGNCVEEEDEYPFRPSSFMVAGLACFRCY